MAERRSFRFVVLLIAVLVAATAIAGPREVRDVGRMPQLAGQSFAGDASAGKGNLYAVLNLDGNMLTMYVYDSERNALRVLYAVAVQLTGEQGRWNVSLAERGVAFELAIDDDGRLKINGERTEMTAFKGERESPTRLPKADCQGSVATNARPDEPESDSLAECALRYVLNGCCDSCRCTHRELGVPRIVDLACCGFGC